MTREPVNQCTEILIKFLNFSNNLLQGTQIHFENSGVDNFLNTKLAQNCFEVQIPRPP